MARLRVWIGRLMEARRGARDAKLFARIVDEHVLQPVKSDQLSNYGNLDAEILKSVAAYDAGNQYSVPYLWGTSGLALNKDKLKAAYAARMEGCARSPIPANSRHKDIVDGGHAPGRPAHFVCSKVTRG